MMNALLVPCLCNLRWKDAYVIILLTSKSWVILLWQFKSFSSSRLELYSHHPSLFREIVQAGRAGWLGIVYVVNVLVFSINNPHLGCDNNNNSNVLYSWANLTIIQLFFSAPLSPFQPSELRPTSREYIEVLPSGHNVVLLPYNVANNCSCYINAFHPVCSLYHIKDTTNTIPQQLNHVNVAVENVTRFEVCLFAMSGKAILRTIPQCSSGGDFQHSNLSWHRKSTKEYMR